MKEFTSEKARRIWYKFEWLEDTNKMNAAQHNRYSEARAKLKAVANTYNYAKDVIYEEFGKNKKEA